MTEPLKPYLRVDPAQAMISVRVYQPQTWWRATARQLGDFVADPDAGVGPRWPSYDQNWRLIGDTVNDVADSIAARAYTPDPDFEDVVFVRVPDKGLDKLESKIVRAWFGAGEGVTTDPWNDSWGDGRHRTFHTAKANPSVSLPVLSDVLYDARGYLDQGWSWEYANSLDKLADVPWFDHSDPLNIEYRRTLQRAAFGIPPSTQPALDVTLEPAISWSADDGPRTPMEVRESEAGSEPAEATGRPTLDPELDQIRRMMAVSFPHPPSAALRQPAPRSTSDESAPEKHTRDFGR